MNIPKAVEIVETNLKEMGNFHPPDYQDAIKLLIEAGKWRLLMKQDYGSWCGPLLPGETEGE